MTMTPEDRYTENVRRQVRWDAWAPTWGADVYTYGVRATMRVGDQRWACTRMLPVSCGIILEGEGFRKSIADELTRLIAREIRQSNIGEHGSITMEWFLLDEQPGHSAGGRISLAYPRYVS